MSVICVGRNDLTESDITVHIEGQNESLNKDCFKEHFLKAMHKMHATKLSPMEDNFKAHIPIEKNVENIEHAGTELNDSMTAELNDVICVTNPFPAEDGSKAPITIETRPRVYSYIECACLPLL